MFVDQVVEKSFDSTCVNGAISPDMLYLAVSALRCTSIALSALFSLRIFLANPARSADSYGSNSTHFSVSRQTTFEVIVL